MARRNLFVLGAPRATNVVRARAALALVRATATPAQRAAEFKTALAMLARPPGANEGMIYDALRQHVVELAWADDLRQHELGAILLADGVIMDKMVGAAYARANRSRAPGPKEFRSLPCRCETR